MRRSISLLGLFLLSCAFCSLLSSQTKKIEPQPAPYTSPASGQEMYKAYCASCHGIDGKGKGPAAEALKAATTDLTTLARDNGGKFPTERVSEAIRTGAGSSAHGSNDMPVWGPVFMTVSDHQRAVVLQRIRNLTTYIEKLQQK